MNIVISPAAEEPIYQQLIDQITAQILSGELAGGCGLPPIRTVAKELGISVIPVKRAWEEMERAGLIVTMQGKGCFVAELASEQLDKKRDNIIIEKLAEEICRCKRMGLNKEEIIEIVKRCYES